MRPWTLAWSVALLASILAGSGPAPARAATILPNPLVIDHTGGAQGELLLVDVITGLPAGGIVSIGAVGPTAQTLVFQGSVAAGSPPPGAGLSIRIRDALGDAVAFAATGFVPGPGSDLLIAGSSSGAATFVFDPQTPGSTFDVVFLSFDTPLAFDGSLFVDAGLENGPPGGSAVLVPEPGTAALVGAGLAFVGLRQRRRDVHEIERPACGVSP